MKKFEFDVSYIEVSKDDMEIVRAQSIPFSATADTCEEARAKALGFAQSIARCYNDNEKVAFYFRICVA